MPKKREPMTVEKIAAALGVSTDNIYRTMRVARQRENSPMRPLYELARREGIDRGAATRVIRKLELEGLHTIKKVVGPKSKRFAEILLWTKDKDVRDAITRSEKLRAKSRSGAFTRMLAKGYDR